jgi:hypothetical protein
MCIIRNTAKIIPAKYSIIFEKFVSGPEEGESPPQRNYCSSEKIMTLIAQKYVAPALHLLAP